ncbi:hypothetical protein HDU96_003864 [Phlyctochytrium bullatum]|nr:hypothetical protein HDU96_003864 [Phlyctochytrium bullatum]
MDAVAVAMGRTGENALVDQVRPAAVQEPPSTSSTPTTLTHPADSAILEGLSVDASTEDDVKTPVAVKQESVAAPISSEASLPTPATSAPGSPAVQHPAPPNLNRHSMSKAPTTFKSFMRNFQSKDAGAASKPSTHAAAGGGVQLSTAGRSGSNASSHRNSIQMVRSNTVTTANAGAHLGNQHHPHSTIKRHHNQHAVHPSNNPSQQTPQQQLDAIQQLNLQRMNLDGAALIVQLAALNKLLQTSNLSTLPKTLAPGPPTTQDIRDTLDAVRRIVSAVHQGHRNLQEQAQAYSRLKADYHALNVRLEKLKREEERREKERASLEARCGIAEAALRSSVQRCRDLENEMARVRKDFRIALEDGADGAGGAGTGSGGGGGAGSFVHYGGSGGGNAAVALAMAAGTACCAGCGAARGAKGAGPLRKWGLTCVRCLEVWRKAREEQEQEVEEAEDESADLHEGVEFENGADDEEEAPAAVTTPVAPKPQPEPALSPEEAEAKIAARAAEVARHHAEKVGTESARLAAKRAEEKALLSSAAAVVAARKREEEAKANASVAAYFRERGVGEDSDSDVNSDAETEGEGQSVRGRSRPPASDPATASAPAPAVTAAAAGPVSAFFKRTTLPASGTTGLISVPFRSPNAPATSTAPSKRTDAFAASPVITPATHSGSATRSRSFSASSGGSSADGAATTSSTGPGKRASIASPRAGGRKPASAIGRAVSPKGVVAGAGRR